MGTCLGSEFSVTPNMEAAFWAFVISVSEIANITGKFFGLAFNVILNNGDLFGV